MATAVLGHKALTAIPFYLNYYAIPKTHIDIPYFAIVYARWFENHFAFIFKGGERLRICGFLAFIRKGAQYLETKNVPLVLIWCMRSYFFMDCSTVETRLIAEALFIKMSIPPKVLTTFSIHALTFY